MPKTRAQLRAALKKQAKADNNSSRFEVLDDEETQIEMLEEKLSAQESDNLQLKNQILKMESSMVLMQKMLEKMVLRENQTKETSISVPSTPVSTPDSILASLIQFLFLELPRSFKMQQLSRNLLLFLIPF